MIGWAIGFCGLCVGLALASKSDREPHVQAIEGDCQGGDCEYPPLGVQREHRPPFPWLPNSIHVAMMSGLQRGITDPQELTLYVMRWVYPLYTCGEERVFWPPACDRSSACYSIWNRVLLRTHRTLATLADETADNLSEH